MRVETPDDAEFGLAARAASARSVSSSNATVRRAAMICQEGDMEAERWIKRFGVVVLILFFGWQAMLIEEVAPILSKLIWLGLPFLMIYLLFI